MPRALSRWFATMSLVVSGRALLAQTNAELAERDAFLVAPLTALPPLQLTAGGSLLSVGLGQRFDFATGDGRSHLALSVSGPILSAALEGAVTAAYLSPACRGCDSWVVGAVNLQRSVSRSVAVRATLGTGVSTSPARGTASSVAISLPVNWTSVSAGALVMPSLVLAGFSSKHEESRGLRPSLAVKAGPNFSWGQLRFHSEGVLLVGSLPTLGVEVTWNVRNR